MRIRLARFLAQAGVASRRTSEDMILAGLVTVNDEVVVEPAITVDPASDEVAVRGETIRPRHGAGSGAETIVVALHKPSGVVTSRPAPSIPSGERTVYDLVEEPEGGRLVYVGRLDRDTEGLLLMTTRGDLAHRLTHPRTGIEREYRVDVVGRLDERALARGARAGIVLTDGRTAPFGSRIVSRRENRRRIEIVLTEGRNREVRRIVEVCGGRVERLVRVRYGPVTLSGIASGAWRRLERDETRRLMERVGLAGR